MIANAIKALLSAAALVGVEPPPAPPDPVVPKVVLRLALSEVDRNQARAWRREAVGPGTLEFAAGFDPEADLWVKLRGRKTVAYPLTALAKGVDTDAGDEPLRVVYENGRVRAIPASGPQAAVSAAGLVRSLHDVSVHVLFAPVEYAVVRESGGPVPDSLCLIREAQDGGLWVTYRTPAQLAEINWFLAVGGTLFGMRLEGAELVFYTEPVPRVPAPRTFRERRLR